jgi:hypothetical protein
MQVVLNKKADGLYTARSTMKMKIFSGADFTQTEEEINEWLSKNPARIEQICQSQCERNGKLLFLVSVFFTPLND